MNTIKSYLELFEVIWTKRVGREFKSPLCYQITTLLAIHFFYFDWPLAHDFTGLEGDSSRLSLPLINLKLPFHNSLLPTYMPT